MKYLFFAASFLVVFICLTTSCQPHSHDPITGAHTHDPVEPEAEALSFTVWSKVAELFVEFPPLVVGQESSFAAHFTEMTNFKGVEAGKAMVCLFENQKEIAMNEVASPSSTGIFLLNLTPPKEGIFDLSFVISTATIQDTISIENIRIYPNKEAALAANPIQPEGDEISFLKEQAWKIDFAVEKAKKGPIHNVIHTSGEIQAVKGEERILAAKTSGIVFFKSKKVQEGREVVAREQLFSISSEGLVQNNLEEDFKIASARLNKTKADFERAEKLLSQQIIGQKEYEQRKMDFSVAEAEFQTLTENYTKGGQMLRAPMSGIIKNVFVLEGQFVEAGTPLLEITSNRRLMIHADVAQQYLSEMHQIQSANFKTPYHKEIQSLDDYNGKLVSYGKMVENKGGFIPVLFELDNVGELIPGSFVELFLLTNPVENALVVPKAALMEDYGSYYVFIQTAGESFEKRAVTLGIDDGENVQVIAGINEGEWIVTKGAYQVKMASMSSSLPAHGHTH